MKSKKIRAFKHFPRWSRWIGFREAFLFFISELIAKKSLRLVNIANEQLYIRTATSDLAVAASCLIFKQYSNLDISHPKVIIDAGANIGVSAIYFARRWPDAKVFAIEPEQENYDIMIKNINPYKNIIPIKAALWGRKETRVIQDRFTGPWGFTISETNNKTMSTGQHVECLTIGSLLDDYDLHNIDILKMDIEGSEKSVLENSDDWIDKVTIITAELHDRICMGCSRAFYLATREFTRFEEKDKIVTAYRK